MNNLHPEIHLENIKHWNLDHILPRQEFDKVCSQINSAMQEYPIKIKKLHATMNENDFKEFLIWDDSIDEKIARLKGLAGSIESTNDKSQDAQLLHSKLQVLDLKLDTITRPISFWLRGQIVEGMDVLDDENAKRLFSSVPKEEYGLNYARTLARHSRSISEEEIISNKDSNGIGTVVDLRTPIENRQTYKIILPNGIEKVMPTLEEARALFQSKDAIERKAAYTCVLNEFEKNADLYERIYNAVVKDWVYEAKSRKYNSPIGMRNIGNSIPDNAVNALISVCEKNTNIFQRYLTLKARQLKIKKLTRFDIYAPIQGNDEPCEYDEAIAIVLDTFKNMGKFKEYAQKIINEEHIDSHPAKNKRGGAYCSTISPNITPYVLLNFTGKRSYISTIAHELGHGVHSLYCNHLSISSQDAPLPLAETASTFAEMALFEKLLLESNDNKQKFNMLAEKMQDSYATTIRQAFITKFEIEMHEKIPLGITRDDIAAAWLDNLHKQFGDAVEVDPIFRHEWSYIPHIVYSPFYCYSYSFGELLSLSLYSSYKKDNKFFSKIENILSAGGSRDPQKLLMEIGIDICSEEFWQGAFNIINSWQEELEILENKFDA